MMNVILYQYNDRDRIVNKYNTGNAMVEVANINLTPYGRFDWNDITFTLKKMYKCNYATYTYNGIKYSGYVTVSVRADGLNEYHITNDPLTTCWENGCFNSAELCVYSSVGDSPVMDTRVIRDNRPTVLTYRNRITTDSPQFVVTVAVDQPGASGRRTNNPMFKCYLFNRNGFDNFLNAMRSWTHNYDDPDDPEPLTNDQYQKNYARFIGCCSSIMGAYMIKDYEKFDTSVLDSAEVMTLRNYTQIEYSYKTDMETGLKYGTKIDGGLQQAIVNSSGAHALDYSSDHDDLSLASYVDIPVGPIYYDRYKQDTEFTVIVPAMGTLSTTWSDVYKRAGSLDTITSVGYLKTWDFVGGTAKAYLTFNNHSIVIPEISIQSSIAYQTPLLVDTTLTDFRSIRLAAITSMTNGVVGAAANLATGNIAGAISSVTGLATSTLGTYASLQAAEDQNLSSGSTNLGSIGGSPDYGLDPYVLVKYKEPINHWAIGNLYGFPDGQSRYLNTIKGYVQTQDCELFVNGLPQDLVKQANQLCDNGVYIL